MITPEDLNAYLDGEADAAKVREVEAALEADAGLRARLDAMQAKDREVKAALDRLLERPVPDSLADAVRASAAAAGGPRPQNDNLVAQAPRVGWTARVLWPAAIAAALVGGVMIGQIAPWRSGGDWTSGRDGSAPVAASAVASALSTAASGAHVALAANRSLTPVMTFTGRDGRLCRQFELAGRSERQDGLACLSGGYWRLIALAPAAVASGGDYRPAAGPGDDPVSAMAARLMRGEPLDAAAEARVLRAR